MLQQTGHVNHGAARRPRASTASSNRGLVRATATIRYRTERGIGRCGSVDRPAEIGGTGGPSLVVSEIDRGSRYGRNAGPSRKRQGGALATSTSSGARRSEGPSHVVTRRGEKQPSQRRCRPTKTNSNATTALVRDLGRGERERGEKEMRCRGRRCRDPAGSSGCWLSASFSSTRPPHGRASAQDEEGMPGS